MTNADSAYGILAVLVCYPDATVEISFPGGQRELGETPLDNVVREALKKLVYR